MSDNKVKTAAAIGLVGATLGIGAITNGVIHDGEETGGTFVTRLEWERWKKEFQTVLYELDSKTDQFIYKRLDEKDKEGYLDNIKIWRTATQSTTRGEVKKEKEEE